MTTDQKIQLVKEISQFHPGYKAGEKYGFSYYVGGMADTGGWHTMKMLEAPEEQLLVCLEQLKEESKPVQPTYTAQEIIDINTPTTHALSGGRAIIHSNAHHDKLWENFQKEFDKRVLWGK